jgi:hypothetical protein
MLCLVDRNCSIGVNSRSFPQTSVFMSIPCRTRSIFSLRTFSPRRQERSLAFRMTLKVAVGTWLAAFQTHLGRAAPRAKMCVCWLFDVKALESNFIKRYRSLGSKALTRSGCYWPKTLPRDPQPNILWQIEQLRRVWPSQAMGKD